MNLSKKDFIKLQSSLIISAVLLSLGGSIVYWLEQQIKVSNRQLSMANTRQQDAARELQLASSEENELTNKAALFKQLQERQIIGPESRLDWVELISKIRKERRLFEIEYEISPQKKLGDTAAKHQFMKSTMSFRLPLLHENDLTIFLDDLQRSAPAIIQANNCTISRMTHNNLNSANLQATCLIDWITPNTERTSEGRP